MENYIRVNETTGQQEYVIDFDGVTAQLPILPLPSGVKICFFNLHGAEYGGEACEVGPQGIAGKMRAAAHR